MFTSDAAITRIGEGLRDHTLPKSEWTHAAHVAAAVWVIAQYRDEAPKRMPSLIRTYNLATGVQNTDTAGYHHTITLASLHAVRRVVTTMNASLFDQTNAVLAVGYDRPEWLLRHYTKERLFSVDARRRWVAPDLAPLP